MNLLDLLAGNMKPGGIVGQTLGETTPTGLAALLQQSQSPGALALGGQPQQPPQTPPQRHGLFGGNTGGTLANIAGVLGDALSGRPTYGSHVMQLREQDQERARGLENYQRNRTDENADWIAHQDYTNAHRPPSALQANTEYIAGLPEGDPRRHIAEQQATGYQYDPEVMAAKQAQTLALIQARLNAGQTLKGTPTYAATHPQAGGGRSITPNARAKYIGEGIDAIRKGADPAAVHARLKKMGVE